MNKATRDESKKMARQKIWNAPYTNRRVYARTASIVHQQTYAYDSRICALPLCELWVVKRPNKILSMYSQEFLFVDRDSSDHVILSREMTHESDTYSRISTTQLVFHCTVFVLLGIWFRAETEHQFEIVRVRMFRSCFMHSPLVVSTALIYL